MNDTTQARTILNALPTPPPASGPEGLREATISSALVAARAIVGSIAPGERRYEILCGQLDAAIAALSAPPPAPETSFQDRVKPWMLACFGAEISANVAERNHRFLEEALELVQSTGCTKADALTLVDYVYGRPVGERAQEVGGTMVTLAALCLAAGLNMQQCAETELARIWTKVEKIRAKRAEKNNRFSPLPTDAPPPAPSQVFLPATILDLGEHRQCHICGVDLAGKQAHFDEQGNAYCMIHGAGEEAPPAPSPVAEGQDELREMQATYLAASEGRTAWEGDKTAALARQISVLAGHLADTMTPTAPSPPPPPADNQHVAPGCIPFPAAPASAQAPVGEGEALARRFHETYERLAPQFGYETRQDTREFDPTSKNGRLMIAVCAALAPAAPVAWVKPKCSACGDTGVIDVDLNPDDSRSFQCPKCKGDAPVVVVMGRLVEAAFDAARKSIASATKPENGRDAQ